MIKSREFSGPTERALAYYRENIEPQLAEDDVNRFIAIDCKSGEWVKSDGRDAVDKLKNRVPDADPFLLVHPRIWIESWGGYGYRECASEDRPG